MFRDHACQRGLAHFGTRQNHFIHVKLARGVEHAFELGRVCGFVGRQCVDPCFALRVRQRQERVEQRGEFAPMLDVGLHGDYENKGLAAVGRIINATVTLKQTQSRTISGHGLGIFTSMSELPAIADSLTELIRASSVSQSDMRPELYAQAYPELRKLAMNWLYRHGGADHLQTTEVLNEGYLRFLQTPEMRAHDRASFFAFASSIIRSVVFDTVRRAKADKRGGNAWITSLDTTLNETIGNPDSEFLELEQAISQLEVVDPRLAYVVDMHFFAEMSMQEIADTLDVNEKTVRRDWKKAQLLLKSMLQ